MQNNCVQRAKVTNAPIIIDNQSILLYLLIGKCRYRQTCAVAVAFIHPIQYFTAIFSMTTIKTHY